MATPVCLGVDRAHTTNTINPLHRHPSKHDAYAFGDGGLLGFPLLCRAMPPLKGRENVPPSSTAAACGSTRFSVCACKEEKKQKQKQKGAFLLCTPPPSPAVAAAADVCRKRPMVGHHRASAHGLCLCFHLSVRVSALLGQPSRGNFCLSLCILQPLLFDDG